jgi:GTP cyclohydrolase II
MEFLDSWLAETGFVPNDRPLVTLSYAQTLDGSISLRRDQALTISGEQSQVLTHKLRSNHDAILVGIGTVLADDPQLNVRLVDGNDPRVIILDSRLRIPTSSRLFKAKKKPLLFYNDSAPQENIARLAKTGVLVEKQAGLAGIDLQMMLRKLKDLDINSVMVEGGGAVIAAFIAGGLVDRLMLTIAPMVVDGYKVPLDLEGSLRLIDTRMEQVGEDIIVLGKFH